ncbi:Aklanonic acid methyltransferase DauC [Pandoraea captiosa]|uniref:Aklanonic acid methyltransferase DauC n=1 Tax=Pandoraea captiosa TaxID=2508302 RepID=A0A5E5ASP7_9BURK|nr:class I SAM-dependent methyltransferase [Pandoraea captiosa]VVE76851.1 Aklanonic acid methyltransferase DauC [Pandoraea captiosa]
MAQITHGIRSILSHPAVYSGFQRFMGAERDRANYVNEYLMASSGMRVLDIGCGPADILAHLPDVEYYGFDISERYIAQANARFSARNARFTCAMVDEDRLAALPRFDRVIAIGLLHHLDDQDAIAVLRMVAARLAPGGRVVTLDPCFTDDQNAIARWLVKSDRGQNVRTREGYNALAQQAFSRVQATVRHKSWIPYTHCHLVCELD